MKNTEAIVKKIYPIVETQIKKNLSNYKRYIGKFISDRSEDLYDIAPYRRIYFTPKDEDELFNTLKLIRKLSLISWKKLIMLRLHHSTQLQLKMNVL